MEFENLVKLIQTVSDSRLTQFSFEENGVSISMKKDKKQKVIAVGGVSENMQSDISVIAQASQEDDSSSIEEKPHSEDVMEGNIVKSPLVGTFYCAPDPDSEPFVKVGDAVSKGQVLGIVEAMKLMNEIESDYDGIVKQVLVSNEDIIEFGQPLFVIG